MTPQAASIARGMLTPAAAGVELGVSGATVLEWCRAGKLVAYRFSRKVVRIKRTDLERFVENYKVE